MGSQLQDELFVAEEAVAREVIQLLESTADGIEGTPDAPAFAGTLVFNLDRMKIDDKSLLAAAVRQVAGRIR